MPRNKNFPITYPAGRELAQIDFASVEALIIESMPEISAKSKVSRESRRAVKILSLAKGYKV